ncbi:hypothetical protein MKW92_047529 [Papaver armeniacum]|nr:hypothetical protein MKW92_047529 [Papaver armeniacum]
MHGYVEFAREIVERYPQLANEKDSLGLTPLHLAAARNDVKMVSLLIKANPDACLSPDQDGRTPLYIAASRNKAEVMELLIQSRPGAIHSSSTQHKRDNTTLKIVDYLLSNSVDLANIPDPISLNSVDSDGNTILHLAAQMKQMKMLKFLLGSNNTGVDTNILNNDGVRALDMLDKNIMEDIEFCFDEYDPTATKEVLQQSTNSEWLRERLNTLMIVAALIAGVAFQAVINPPGGVVQEDSKIDSIKDPVMFTYYLKMLSAIVLCLKVFSRIIRIHTTCPHRGQQEVILLFMMRL